MQLTDLKWTDVAKISRDVPVVIPVAALEQHGHHMPLFTDSMLLGEVVRRATAVVDPQKVLFAPLLWLGNSEHHLDFPGTMTAAPRTYLDLINDMAENFLFHGFKRIVFVNGHGGNHVPGQQATFELRQRHRTQADLLLLWITYWETAKPDPKSIKFEQTRMGHACEFETSMMLRLNPHLVGDLTNLQTVDGTPPFDSGGSRAWITKDRTAAGHIGMPQHATAEKGEVLFQTFSAGLVKMIDRVVAWDGKSWAG